MAMTHFLCPYLNSVVELTNEREKHITDRHPDLLPEHYARLADALADPDQIRRSTRFANAGCSLDGSTICEEASIW